MIAGALWLLSLVGCVVMATFHSDELRGLVWALLALAVVQLGRD